MNAQQMKEVADLLGKSLPAGTGFVVLAFPAVDNSGLQKWHYVSNCDRNSMIEGLEMILNTWKNQNIQNN